MTRMAQATEGPSICTLFAFLLLFYVNSGHVRNPGSNSRDDLTFQCVCSRQMRCPAIHVLGIILLLSFVFIL